jgi:CDP-diacylglycerol--glycerol-3-phosphate 3-phosphatidyltransferase
MTMEQAETESALATGKSLNVPNVLSAIRLLLSCLVVAFVPLRGPWYIAAFVLFVIAASTDWLDGWYARKYNQVTQLGRILDPFCDKIIICGTFIVLSVEMRDFPWYAQIAGWMAVVVMGREILVTALRSFIESAGGDFSASMAGKLKMVFQCIAAGAAFMTLILNEQGDNTLSNVPAWIVGTLVVFVWLALILTVYSGTGYVLAAAKFIKSSQAE